MELQDAVGLVCEEYIKAEAEFPRFHTNHEGYGIIKEEFDELWDEIKARHPAEKGNNNMHRALKTEAIQLAAMALRFLIDRC